MAQYVFLQHASAGDSFVDPLIPNKNHRIDGIMYPSPSRFLCFEFLLGMVRDFTYLTRPKMNKPQVQCHISKDCITIHIIFQATKFVEQLYLSKRFEGFAESVKKFVDKGDWRDEKKCYTLRERENDKG